MPGPEDIVLHHYDRSPFSQKVRELLGIKGLAWRSVQMPDRMPKPDLVPLTGGYRRAPVMQIGADVYCDSQVIMAEIERRHPEPATDIGPGWAVNLWADRLFFPPTVAIIFGSMGDRVDHGFVADREKLSGRPFDVAAMGRAVEPAKTQWRAFAGWIEQALNFADFLAGERPGIADVAAHMNIWFLANTFPDLAEELLEGLPQVAKWRERLAGSGQGERNEITGSEALDLARKCEPAPCPAAHDPVSASGMDSGAEVVVMADDYGRDPIAGMLVAASPERIVIARDDGDLGAMQLHFPRAGFVLLPNGG